jgi:hypothetical protein
MLVVSQIKETSLDEKKIIGDFNKKIEKGKSIPIFN